MSLVVFLRELSRLRTRYQKLTRATSPRELSRLRTWYQQRRTTPACIFYSMKSLFLWRQLTHITHIKSKWVWSGNSTITYCRPTHDTARKSYRTFIETIHLWDNNSKATSIPGECFILAKMPPCAVFHLGLHCLPKYLLTGIQNKGVNVQAGDTLVQR